MVRENYFCRGDWALSYFLMQFWKFPKILRLNPTILSHLTTSEATRILVSYTSYEIPFTCGKRKMSNEADTALLNLKPFYNLGT